MQSSIKNLGDWISVSWEKSSFDKEHFIDVVSASLETEYAQELLKNFSIDKLSNWIACSELPRQGDPNNKFGQPPVTLYRDKGSRFIIDLYCWLSPDTSIHDHGFGGVCLLLDGKSLQVEHTFEAFQESSSDFTFGSLSVKETKIFQKGDSFSIPFGSNFIHKITHLSFPTVSLVIRTVGFHLPQYNYFPPSFSMRYIQDPQEDFKKKLSFFHFLKNISHASLKKYRMQLFSEVNIFHAMQYFWAILATSKNSKEVEILINELPNTFLRYKEPLYTAAITQINRKAFQSIHLPNESVRALISLIDTFGLTEEALNFYKKNQMRFKEKLTAEESLGLVAETYRHENKAAELIYKIAQSKKNNISLDPELAGVLLGLSPSEKNLIDSLGSKLWSFL